MDGGSTSTFPTGAETSPGAGDGERDGRVREREQAGFAGGSLERKVPNGADSPVPASTSAGRDGAAGSGEGRKDRAKAGKESGRSGEGGGGSGVRKLWNVFVDASRCAGQ